MPTYQYACTECGHAFDQVQKFSEDSLTVCPVCQGRLRKVFNAVGVVFKGSGFYATDSRASAASGSSPSASDTAAKSDSTSESKSDSKSDSKKSDSSTSTTASKDSSSSSSGSSSRS